MLSRPEGVSGDNTPFSIDYGMVNSSSAADAYKQATKGQLPAALLQGSKCRKYFTKKEHQRSGNILTFAPGVLDYLLGHTNAMPGTVFADSSKTSQSQPCGGMNTE
jgi:hypothetical protein